MALTRWTAGLTIAPGLTGLASCVGGPPIPENAFVIDRSKVPDGAVVSAKFRGKPLLVLNRNGAFSAVSGMCTHEGCELGWNPRQQLIRCPCHGSSFLPDGQVKSGPAERSLARYQTEVRGKRVVVVVSG